MVLREIRVWLQMAKRAQMVKCQMVEWLSQIQMSDAGWVVECSREMVGWVSGWVVGWAVWSNAPSGSAPVSATTTSSKTNVKSQSQKSGQMH
jgi:hypothetical protein